ncbi:MAG: O-antigen ligase family protein [Microbacteriaceae bacterium]|nr:O-antigen ligase family protein [Microbacteriaceae bacterium]
MLVLFTGIAGDFWRNLLGWYGYGAIVLVVVALAIVVLVHNRDRFAARRLPYPLLAFLIFATLSIAWSYYRLPSVLGASVQWATTAAAIAVAVTLSWAELLVALGWVFRLVLGLSFVFEFIVSAFIRHPVYPVWVVPDDPAHPAKLLYWSRNLLFDAGKIQGIVGNSSLLAMAALLALIVFSIQLLSRSVGRFWGWFWFAVAVVTIVLTRSATIFVGLAVVVIVAIAVLVVRRAATPRGRSAAFGGIAIVVVVLAVGGFVFRAPLLGVLGKSADFTGRIGIWQAVIGLAQQRPAVGWGWISYWMPWVAPFDHLIKRGGVQVMHAHDAWLDVWLQLGIVGLVIFGLLVLGTLLRSWFTAIDPVKTHPALAGTYSWVTMLPILMLSAQLVQSIAESRMLIEGGWILLVIWAVKTRLTQSGQVPAAIPVAATPGSA